MVQYHKFQLVLIGSGRLARSLGLALKAAGHCLVQEYSPTLAHAKNLATDLDSSIYTNKLSDLIRNADCYIIAVKDDAIADVVKQLNVGKSLVVHTSGSTPVDVFKECIGNYGVFYPFQTFTGKPIPFQDIPIFIEGSSREYLLRLKELGKSISEKVLELSTENRLKLHAAAVFACNFTNHMLVLSNEILKSANLDFSLLHHLVSQTVSNAFSANNPLNSQTGPAARNDINIINEHIELLADYPDLQSIYQQLTDSIIKQHHE